MAWLFSPDKSELSLDSNDFWVVKLGVFAALGTVFKDLNENCNKNNYEFNLNGQIISVQPGNLFYMSNNSTWVIDSLPPGTYTATVDTSGPWKATCSPSVTFSILHPDSMVHITPIGMKNVNPCSKPEVSLIAPTVTTKIN